MLLVFQFGRSSLIQYLQRKALGILGNAASGKVHKIHLWYPAAQIFFFFFIKSIVDCVLLISVLQKNDPVIHICTFPFFILSSIMF